MTQKIIPSAYTIKDTLKLYPNLNYKKYFSSTKSIRYCRIIERFSKMFLKRTFKKPLLSLIVNEESLSMRQLPKRWKLNFQGIFHNLWCILVKTQSFWYYELKWSSGVSPPHNVWYSKDWDPPPGNFHRVGDQVPEYQPEVFSGFEAVELGFESHLCQFLPGLQDCYSDAPGTIFLIPEN